MPIIIILVLIFIIALFYHMALGLLAWLNFGTGFYVLSALCLALIIYNIISGKKALKNNESNNANIVACTLGTIGLVIFLVCGIATPYAVNWQKEADVNNAARRAEEAERKIAKEEQKKAEAEQEAQKAAIEAERKAQSEAEEKERASHADEYVRTWCSRMRILMNDTDEQWEHWWPIATGSHDVVIGYDAANTLNLNLKQYFDSLNGSNYEITKYATDAQKNQMKEIKKTFSESLWKRVKASEQYAKALKSGNFDMKEAEGIRRRAIEAESTAEKASSLLKAFEGIMGM